MRKDIVVALLMASALGCGTMSRSETAAAYRRATDACIARTEMIVSTCTTQRECRNLLESEKINCAAQRQRVCAQGRGCP